MAGGILGLDDVAVDHLLDHRVILRHLSDRAGVQQVHAAVADVRDLGARGVREHRHHGGARAKAALVGGHAPDATVRLLDRHLERIARRGDRGRGEDDLADGLRRELGGLLAPGVAAHAVAHDREEAVRRLHVEGRVLVDLLLRIAPGIGTERDLDRRRVGILCHRRTSLIRASR